MTLDAAQGDLQCTACGGQCTYAPDAQALRCLSCATVHPIEVDPDADPAREFHYAPEMPHTEQTVVEHIRTHQCETCGGEVIFTGPVLSERCAYCDGPVVLKERDASYQTMGVIPFHMAEDDAQVLALDWVKRRLAAPNDLADVVAKGRVAGIYVPFWTFDSEEFVNYTVRYRVKRGKRWYNRSTTGQLNTSFNDMLAPASHHITPLIRDGILHEFDPRELRPYMPEYLAGFPAERHHQSVTEGLAANDADKRLLLRNQIKRHSRKRNISSISFKTHTSGIRYRRILLPVWILHYACGGKAKKVVVCGLHGRTFGERPFSTPKLAGYAAAISLGAILFGWVWGAAQFI
ncbi:MAG: hypothetical protein AAFU41_15855 [Pseudomonadota bacterium]